MRRLSFPRELVAPAALGALVGAGCAWLGAPVTLLGAAAGAATGFFLLVLRRREEAVAATEPEAPAAETLPFGVGREVLEHLPLGLILLDARGKTMFENEAARDLLDRATAGLHFTATLRAPALVSAVRGALEDSVAAELDSVDIRGGDRVVEALVRPLPNGEAGPARRPAALLLLEDRTRMARAEALRRDFVANASHELKTPLASIAGFIETLQGHARDDPEAAERFLKIMADQALRMRRLVDDLLSLNRIETNEHVRPRDLLDLAALAHEVAEGLEPVAAAAGATVRVDLPAAGFAVRGDRQQLAQVLTNLIDNAIKYAGGEIRLAPPESDALRPGQLGVSVIDSGPGIAREHLPRLTERFYRVDVARSRERGGTGLGLAIAKHILNRHRGDLTVTSRPGDGARFTLWLPDAAQQSGQSRAAE